jgi:DNA-binding LacI/PurR family transcriptional regulator
MEAGRKAGLELLTKKARPDVVFVSTIMMGIGFIRAAHELGIGIPNEVRVAALHDSDIANYLTPSLTTIHLPTVEMGSQSVDLLLRIIGGGMPGHLIVDTPPVLVERDSTAKPKRQIV